MRQVSIFLVEDEALVRILLVEMLEELGHRVVAEASSIDQAKTAHQVHNPEVAFDADGQAADVIWAMNDRVQMAPDKQHENYGGHTGYGNYRERYVKCADGKWRIKMTQLSYFRFDPHPR